MARRRSDSTTSECSSEGGGGGEDRQRSSRSKRRRSKREDSSPPRSRSHSASRLTVPARYSTGRRVAVVQHSPSRSRSNSASRPTGASVVEYKRRPSSPSRRRARSPQQPPQNRSRSRSPVHYRSSRERRERSNSRSRSRSRSSTPARYEAHIRSLREFGSGSGRGGSSRGGHYGGRGDHHHHHRHESSRGERGEGFHQDYDTGARRGGFIRSRNMIEDGRDDPRPSNCLGVFGMPPWVREYDMRNMFEAFGEVDQLNVVINRHTGQCRGYGFVYFTTVEDAKRARSAMRDAKIDGIPIRVDYSVTDQRRPSYRDNL